LFFFIDIELADFYQKVDIKINAFSKLIDEVANSQQHGYMVNQLKAIGYKLLDIQQDDVD
jgi:hypothetical protein